MPILANYNQQAARQLPILGVRARLHLIAQQTHGVNDRTLNLVVPLLGTAPRTPPG